VTTVGHVQILKFMSVLNLVPRYSCVHQVHLYLLELLHHGTRDVVNFYMLKFLHVKKFHMSKFDRPKLPLISDLAVRILKSNKVQ
jgi:hypothetical protein